MPLLTMATVISRIRLSVPSRASLFQLFQPIGGVAATFVDCATVVCGHAATTNRLSVASKKKAARLFRLNFPAATRSMIFASRFGLADYTVRKISHLLSFRGRCLPEEPAFALFCSTSSPTKEQAVHAAAHIAQVRLVPGGELHRGAAGVVDCGRSFPPCRPGDVAFAQGDPPRTVSC